MKKSVVILIAIIYVASIALVNFLGLDFKVFNEVVYVQEIEILNEGLKENAVFGKYTVINLGADGTASYQIRYRVHPDEASNQAVEFSYDKQTPGVTIDENGVVIFTASGSVAVDLVPLDGSEARARITIVCK